MLKLINKMFSIFNPIKYRIVNYCWLIWKFICLHYPLCNNKIVASNFLGNSYGDNPGAIFNEILNQKMHCDLVWLQNNMDDPVPQGVRKVSYGSWQAFYELSTAKIFINNVKNGPSWHKRRGQFYIQTWHGAFPLKYIEREIEDFLPDGYIRFSKNDSYKTDLMLSGSKMISEVMRTSFWYLGEIFECGSPRNDILFNYKWKIKEIKKKYGLPYRSKVLLYAPTFRDDESLDAFNFDIKSFILFMEQQSGEQWIGIIRLHPNIKNQDFIFEYSEKIINGSSFADAQELLLVSDFLITDYSSIMMDFGIMKKPVFLYVPDLEEYINKGRGLRPIIDALPFPLCRTNKELSDLIRSFDYDKYLKDLESFTYLVYGSFEDGHASEKVVERIKKVLEKR